MVAAEFTICATCRPRDARQRRHAAAHGSRPRVVAPVPRNDEGSAEGPCRRPRGIRGTRRCRSGGLLRDTRRARRRSKPATLHYAQRCDVRPRGRAQPSDRPPTRGRLPPPASAGARVFAIGDGRASPPRRRCRTPGPCGRATPRSGVAAGDAARAPAARAAALTRAAAPSPPAPRATARP